MHRPAEIPATRSHARRAPGIGFPGSRRRMTTIRTVALSVDAAAMASASPTWPSDGASRKASAQLKAIAHTETFTGVRVSPIAKKAWAAIFAIEAAHDAERVHRHRAGGAGSLVRAELAPLVEDAHDGLATGRRGPPRPAC